MYYGVLEDEERRIAIEALRDLTSPSLDELARAIHERNGSSKDEHRVKVALYHNHLPRLEDIGAVEYDPEQGRIQPDDATLQTLNRVMEETTTALTEKWRDSERDASV